MSATIRDIKKRTGLSLATISKYLNGGNVLPQNKVLIEEAIEELHYEVNQIARGLVTNKSGLVGILVYNIECTFVGKMIHYMGEIFREHGYGLLICDSSNDTEIEKSNLQFLLNRKVDGIVVMPVGADSSFLNKAKNADVPVVTLDRYYSDGEFDSVMLDNRAAVVKAVNVLLRNHHKDIAIIGSNTEYTGIERIRGYEDALRSAGVEIKEEYRYCGKHSFELGYEGMRAMLRLKERPTAVIFANYETTLGGVMAINESNLSCPEDISMIGFDNLIMTDVLQPKMWVVEQPMREMSAKAAELLCDRMKSEDYYPPVAVYIGAVLQEGETVLNLMET